MSDVLSLLESSGFRLMGLAILVVATVGFVRYIVVFAASRWLKVSGLTPHGISIRRHFYPALSVTLLGAIMDTVLPLFELPARLESTLSHSSQIILIFGFTWLLIRVTSFVEIAFRQLLDISRADNLRERRLRTQMQFIARIVMIAIGVLGMAIILLTFPGARRLGASLLASAGIASVVIGFAAQRSLGNFIAGFQIAFTQPIRIDDVVIVEKEWGRVEEITLTYVVVKIWDERRMVLPITYFIEKPFENWTRRSSEIMGTVFLSVNFNAPLEELREELKRVVTHSNRWDGRTCLLQVTDTSERAMQLRILLSARDASIAFDLRCEVREAMITYLQKHYPDALPKFRAELAPGALEEISALPSRDGALTSGNA